MGVPVKTSGRKRTTSRQPPIYEPALVGDILFVVGLVFLAVFVWFAWFLFQAKPSDKPFAMVFGALWVVGIPIFFFIEHVYFFRKWGNPDQYDQFKRLQDQAAKVWAAAIVVLGTFFTNAFPSK